MDFKNLVRNILKSSLQLDDKVNSFNDDTGLFGSLPEFDSMAIVNIITAIEESLGSEIEDDEITAEVFETFGSLVAFVEAKAEE